MAYIAAIQMASTSDSQQNLANACDYIKEAAEKGAQMVALPEEFISLGLTPEQKREIAEPYLTGPIQQVLSATAKRHNIWVVGGTLPLRSEDPNKYYSSCLTWDNAGNCIARYDKIHLFDVTVASGESYLESERVKAGSHATVFDTPFGKVGVAICYDLRFPELFRLLMLQGAQIIILPSAFTMNTGKVHWEILLKARAIENLCYMVAPDQIGIRLSGHGTYGHSMIVGPWGEILVNMENNEGLICAELPLEALHQLRTTFPAHTHLQPHLMKNLANMRQKENS